MWNNIIMKRPMSAKEITLYPIDNGEIQRLVSRGGILSR